MSQNGRQEYTNWSQNNKRMAGYMNTEAREKKITENVLNSKWNNIHIQVKEHVEKH